MITRILAGVAAAVLACNLAVAHPGIILSKGGQVTSVVSGSGIYVPPPTHDAGATVIFSNIATKYPLGLYFCCSGATVSGPNSELGFQSWPAMQFTPSADISVTEIDVAVQWLAGADEVDLDLYSDADGVPGTLLKSFKATDLVGNAGCCGFAVGKDKQGIAITGGTPYWIAVTSDAQGTDTFANWMFNSTDQLDKVPSAVNKGAGWVTNGGAVPAAAFAVYGK
ncbi:MAG TPA: choice-of-anchor R domain-containing protein [Rhizomicrobium sp.]|jgi:hypothetical protein